MRPPPEGEVGTEVYDHTMDATSGIAWDRSRSLEPTFAQQKKRTTPLSPDGMDHWVYEFSNDNVYSIPEWHTLDDGPNSK